MKARALTKPGIYTGNLILVNWQHPYRADRLSTLVPLQEGPAPVFLERRAAVLLSSLMEQIHGWQHIVPVSGYRSRAEQREIWEQSLSEHDPAFTQTYVALPGHSEHQTGLAIDLGLRSPHMDLICPDFPYSGICQTFREHAAHFGFVERYPAGKEEITGIGQEPWHFRYVGAPHAEIMTAMGLTLEEYHIFLKQFPYGAHPFVFENHRHTLEISYLPAGETSFWETPPGPYLVSGNNMDGYIITIWKD